MVRALPPLNALRAFEAAARHLSFTRAAEELRVTQAAVSHQVKALEQRLGVALFRRLTRGLRLTDEGQALLPDLRDGFDRLAQAVERVGRRGSQGRLTVSLLTTFALSWLVPRLPRFNERHPEIEVSLIASQRLADFADDDSVWQDLQWTPQAEQGAVAAARVRATIKNAPGVLGQVATLIGEAGGNILNLVMSHRQQDFFDVDIDVEVEDAKHATTIMAALRANPSVDTVERARG